MIASSFHVLDCDLKQLCLKFYKNGFPKDFVEECISRYTPGIPNDGIPNDGIPNCGVPKSTFGIPKQTPGIPNCGIPNGGIPKSLLHVSKIIS